jgi:hypothetical protein
MYDFILTKGECDEDRAKRDEEGIQESRYRSD